MIVINVSIFSSLKYFLTYTTFSFLKSKHRVELTFSYSVITNMR